MNKISIRSIILFCSVVIVFSCKDKSSDEVINSSLSEVALIESTLTNFSNALAIADSSSLQKLASPNFVLLDEGKDYDFPLMIQQIKTLSHMGVMTRKPQMFHTVIHKDVAWSYYQVLVNFRAQQKSSDFSLLESAVLEKTNEGWVITMMTTIPQIVK